jgi:hypothetical protein
MPPLPPIPGVVRLALNFNNSPASGNQRAVNILHLQWSPSIGFTAVELTSVANNAMTWWNTHFLPLEHLDWQLASVVATAADGTGVQGVSNNGPFAGLSSGNALPPQVAACISWQGAPSYRGGKPRTYVVGIPTSANILGTSALTSAFATSLRTAAIAALGDMAGFTIGGAVPTLGAVSYVKKALNPTPPHYRTTPLFWQYLTAKVHERLDSQRRRSGKESAFPFL